MPLKLVFNRDSWSITILYDVGQSLEDMATLRVQYLHYLTKHVSETLLHR